MVTKWRFYGSRGQNWAESTTYPSVCCHERCWERSYDLKQIPKQTMWWWLIACGRQNGIESVEVNWATRTTSGMAVTWLISPPFYFRGDFNITKTAIWSGVSCLSSPVQMSWPVNRLAFCLLWLLSNVVHDLKSLPYITWPQDLHSVMS